MGRPAVSKHLRVLEGAGLVVHHSVGTRNLYALAPEGFTTLQQWLVGAWDQTLAAFADRVAEKEAQNEQESADESVAADSSAGVGARCGCIGVRGLHGRHRVVVAVRGAQRVRQGARPSPSRAIGWSSRGRRATTRSGARCSTGIRRAVCRITWHPGSDPAKASEVEVTFAELPGDQVLVTLEHRGWERFTDPVAARSEYNHGWPLVLAGYADLASGETPVLRGEGPLWLALLHTEGPALPAGNRSSPSLTSPSTSRSCSAWRRKACWSLRARSTCLERLLG